VLDAGLQVGPGVGELGGPVGGPGADRDLPFGSQPEPGRVALIRQELGQPGGIGVGVFGDGKAGQLAELGGVAAVRAFDGGHDPAVGGQKRRIGAALGQLGRASLLSPASSSSRNDDQMIMAALPAR
jgi:hypothetical protein